MSETLKSNSIPKETFWEVHYYRTPTAEPPFNVTSLFSVQLLRAFLWFSHTQLLRCKPGLMPGSDFCLLLCFVTWPSPWLLHFPHPVRRSLVCLWNGSSAGLHWDVTEKQRSAAPHLCVPLESPAALWAVGLLPALKTYSVYVCVCVSRKREGFMFVWWGWAFLHFALEATVTLS